MLILGIPVEFFLFGFTLLGVALFHHHTLKVAVTGLVVITLFKLLVTDFAGTPGVAGLMQLLSHEWVTIGNLFGLLLGFALLADHFEKTEIPAILPDYLPDDWKGGFVMLILVFFISSFLDNIAAAIGEEPGTIEDVIEPYLIQQGYLQRTPRGRIATLAAYRHLGVTPPKGAGGTDLFGE